MAQLPKGGLERSYDKPIHGSCAIYFPDGILSPVSFRRINRCTATACSNTALKVVVAYGKLHMYGHVSFVHQKSLAGRLDVAFNLCPGTEVLEAQNDFPVTLKLSLSQDGMYFVHLGHLRPGRSSWNFRANYVRIQWTRTKELLVDAPRGILGLFGHPCLDSTNLTLPEGEWHLPQVSVQPQNCFATALSKHCCHPLRPQCWGYNTLLAMACCAVPFEKSTATCLVSNSKFPNSNQDCRGRPVNYFRTFGDGNELRLLVGGRIWQRPQAEINASLSIGCLFQSVVYLFHELHHLSRDAAFLNAMSSQQLYLYVRLFQADRWQEGSEDRQVARSALKGRPIPLRYQVGVKATMVWTMQFWKVPECIGESDIIVNHYPRYHTRIQRLTTHFEITSEGVLEQQKLWPGAGAWMRPWGRGLLSAEWFAAKPDAVPRVADQWQAGPFETLARNQNLMHETCVERCKRWHGRWPVFILNKEAQELKW